MNKKPIIVVVEDEPIELLLLAKTLQHNTEYVVHQAINMRDAYVLCERVKPDIIISDFNMPGGTGFDLCVKVKQHPVLRNAMFILLTGVEDVQHKIKGLNIGADEYLTKPYHSDELLSRVNAFLRIKALQDNIEADKAQLAKLNTELEGSFRGVIALLSNLIELRVPNASARSKRAKDITEWVCKKLSIAEDRIEDFLYAALLHEIGKISMPDLLVRKNPNELKAEEQAELIHFPVCGQLLIQEIPVLKSVSYIIRHQMENYDGTGYPDRLMQEEIPLGARIQRIINGVETMLQKPSTTIPHIVDELMSKKGILYDPHITMLVVDFLQTNDQEFSAEKKRQISVLELQPGMKIARDLYTGTGVKLLTENTVLNENTIKKITAHHQLDPILTGVYIFAESK